MVSCDLTLKALTFIYNSSLLFFNSKQNDSTLTFAGETMSSTKELKLGQNDHNQLQSHVPAAASHMPSSQNGLINPLRGRDRG